MKRGDIIRYNRGDAENAFRSYICTKGNHVRSMALKVPWGTSTNFCDGEKECYINTTPKQRKIKCQ